MNNRHLLGFISALLIVLISVYFQNQIINLKAFGLLGVFLASFLGNATFLVPLANNFKFEPLSFGLVTSLGGTFGQMIGFELGLSGQKLFIREHHIIFKVLRDTYKDYGKFVIFFFAFLPDQAFGVISLLSGISNYSPLKFFILVLAGRIIRSLIFQ